MTTLDNTLGTALGFPLGDMSAAQPPEMSGIISDWLRHPSSSTTLDYEAQFTGGPTGGIGNALRFDLTATSARQRVAYINSRLGSLRGTMQVAMSVYLTNDAVRTRVGVMTRWSSADLDATDRCYTAEIMRDEGALRYVLRHGPEETGEVLLQATLDSDLGFDVDTWLEIGMALQPDTVGNLKIASLLRPNGEVGDNTFDIDGHDWYTVGTALIDRYSKRDVGSIGLQIVTRSGAGYVQIGHVRAIASSNPSFMLLPDDVTA